jgi:thiamine kinase-like enzyme
MEDISADYQPLSYKSPQLPQVAGDLSSLHATMQEWMRTLGENRLLRFGSAFSAGLVEYARMNLERYARVSASPMVTKVCDEWTAVIDVYQRPEFRAREHLRPIHGDYSPANIYLSRHNPARLKILDWEWAGIGVPHADLAALLKRTSPEIEQQALARYSERDRTFSPEEHRRIYEWCQLERGLLDAAYLAKQHLDAPVKTDSIPGYIERSLERCLHAIQRLS